MMLSHVVVHDDTRSLKEYADDKEHHRIISKSESKESKSVFPGSEPDSNDLTCILDCTKTFRTKEDLNKHMIAGDHNGHFFFACSKCPKKFGSTKEMKIHGSRAHDQGQKRQEEDVKMIPTEFLFTCSKCPKTFESTSNMRKHMTTAHIQLLDWKEQSRVQVQTDTKSMSLPTSDVSEEKVYSKLDGNLSITANSELKPITAKSNNSKDEGNNENMLDLKCKECGNDLPSLSSLRIHKQIHEEQNIHICVAGKGCSAKFSSKIRLSNHMLAEHGVENVAAVRTRHTCKICGKICNTAHRLKDHMVSHSTEKTLVCVECGKFLKTERSLLTHSLLHTGIKNIQCDQCEQIFYTRSALINHKMRNHNEGDPEKLCPTCGEKCCSKASLKRHMIRHTGQRPYKCATCEKDFFDKQTRRIHERIHKDTFEFQCNRCEKQFHQSHQLVAHTKRHNGVRNDQINL